MRILSIDPGSLLGWATNATGRIEHGCEDFRIKGGESSGNRWRRYSSWLLDALVIGRDGKGSTIDMVVYERSIFPAKARFAAEVAAGFTTRLEEMCECQDIALQPIGVQEIKSYAIPPRPTRRKGAPRLDRGKDAMIAAAQARLNGNARPLTEHEADALWLLWLAQERYARG